MFHFVISNTHHLRHSESDVSKREREKDGEMDREKLQYSVLRTDEHSIQQISSTTYCKQVTKTPFETATAVFGGAARSAKILRLFADVYEAMKQRQRESCPTFLNYFIMPKAG